VVETVKACGETDIGGYPIREMVCDRQAGHEGWHNESATGSSWPPKSKPVLTACVDCGENAPEQGLVCDECRTTSLND